MTTQEIYTIANQTTEAQFNNLFNLFTDKEVFCFNKLVNLGDSKNLALWTIISGRYENNQDSEIYKLAYNS